MIKLHSCYPLRCFFFRLLTLVSSLHHALLCCVQTIEDHFVSLRQSRPKETSESTLHLLLNLARLHCLSHLEGELASNERWAEVTALFEKIHQRQQA